QITNQSSPTRRTPFSSLKGAHAHDEPRRGLDPFRGARAGNANHESQITNHKSIPSLADHLPRNHNLLNLRRPFANRAELGVAIELFDREVFGITVSTKYLYRLIGNGYSCFGGVKLGHGGGFRHRLPCVFQPGGPERKKTSCLDARGHVGQLKGDALKG